jgi:hypothetical protein
VEEGGYYGLQGLIRLNQYMVSGVGSGSQYTLSGSPLGQMIRLLTQAGAVVEIWVVGSIEHHRNLSHPVYYSRLVGQSQENRCL